MALRRGFKAEAERRATALWSEVGADIALAIDLHAAAANLGARIVMADALVPIARLEQLEAVQAFAFSACTFAVRDRPVIVLNPLRSRGRQRADAAHELSHLLLRHQMRVPERIGSYVFFTGNAEQENEAGWMAGALLLPRHAVLRAAHVGMDAPALALHYETTEEMARFRLYATGAAIQARRGRLAERGAQAPRQA
jgi:Zn-dependent peptidase ImmA (M78 family)